MHGVKSSKQPMSSPCSMRPQNDYNTIGLLAAARRLASDKKPWEARCDWGGAASAHERPRSCPGVSIVQELRRAEAGFGRRPPTPKRCRSMISILDVNEGETLAIVGENPAPARARSAPHPGWAFIKAEPRGDVVYDGRSVRCLQGVRLGHCFRKAGAADLPGPGVIAQSHGMRVGHERCRMSCCATGWPTRHNARARMIK